PESSFYLQPQYCKDNSYKIKGSSFDLSYGSGKVLTEEDRYGNKPAGNDLKTPVVEEVNPQKHLLGVVSPLSSIKVSDANFLQTPVDLYESKAADAPVITGMLPTSTAKEC